MEDGCLTFSLARTTKKQCKLVLSFSDSAVFPQTLKHWFLHNALLFHFKFRCIAT